MQPRVNLKPYSADRLDECVSLLAEAFVTSPLHRCAFGPERLDRNRTFFRIGLRNMFVGQSFVALEADNGAMCGYIHFNRWPHCLPAPEEVPRVVALHLLPLGEALPQVIRWFGRWCHRDPAEPHVHLGPIGVAPGKQRQGVGTMLMRHYIDHLEREKAAGYLETDRLENVRFYEKFGFSLQGEEELIGTSVWYMWRAADI